MIKFVDIKLKITTPLHIAFQNNYFVTIHTWNKQSSFNIFKIIF